MFCKKTREWSFGHFIEPSCFKVMHSTGGVGGRALTTFCSQFLTFGSPWTHIPKLNWTTLESDCSALHTSFTCDSVQHGPCVCAQVCGCEARTVRPQGAELMGWFGLGVRWKDSLRNSICGPSVPSPADLWLPLCVTRQGYLSRRTSLAARAVGLSAHTG